MHANRHQVAHCWIRFKLRFCLLVPFLTLQVHGAESATLDIQGRGQEIIRQFIEVNRYWLVGPPESVREYRYVLHRISGTQNFAVTDPRKAPRARRQGVTYSTMLHQLAAKPASATVRSLTEEPGRVRLTLAFDPAVRGACGNGVENSWNGYHSVGGNEGYLLLDAQRMVPLEAGLGRLTETFGEYFALDDAHSVPLKIAVQIEETRYDWRFRVHEPGLWLFDDSHAGERRLAWTERVEVNSAQAVLRHAAEGSLAREQAEAEGQKRLRTFRNANFHWLLPSLRARRGLVYEYRQEAPYLERVMFDPDGHIMVRLEASRDSPDKPTQQRLWLADGRRVSSVFGDRYVASEPVLTDLKSLPFSVLLLDRHVQHLAMGLGWECALTRLAREPEAFWTEVQNAGRAGQYRLVLHTRKDARLFTGTMLTFSSWAFMHDVGFDRSEILCDAATHRPLEERDIAGKDETKGHYFLENWLDDPSGAAPGRIRAVIPYEKDGKDQALEMIAQFRFAKPGVWLLERVESHFRGAGGSSTGTVQVVSAEGTAFAPVQQLLETVKATEATLASAQTGPEGFVEREVRAGEWQPLALKAAWTAKAKESAQAGEGNTGPKPLIGIHRAKIEQAPAGLTIELDGLSTAYWKEFLTEWKVDLLGGSGQPVAGGKTNLVIKAEKGPGPFLVRLEVPLKAGQSLATVKRASIEGSVLRMTGMYHGHGLWLRLADKE